MFKKYKKRIEQLEKALEKEKKKKKEIEDSWDIQSNLYNHITKSFEKANQKQLTNKEEIRSFLVDVRREGQRFYEDFGKMFSSLSGDLKVIISNYVEEKLNEKDKSPKWIRELANNHDEIKKALEIGRRNILNEKGERRSE